MRRISLIVCALAITAFAHAQGLVKRLDEAVKNFEEDNQMQNGLLGFYVVEQKTGETIYERNATTGMAVASSQKVITSTAALELLGTDYRFKTLLAYNGNLTNGSLNGNVYIIGFGDPTLGSWRYNNTKEDVVLNEWVGAMQTAGIKKVAGNLIGYDRNWQSQTTPGGWVWDDIGNYYGAGVGALNWHENQYDLTLRSGREVGDNASIVGAVPKLYDVTLIDELTTGKAESGDNSVIYLPPFGNVGFVRGTIPANKSSFTVSGSIPNPTFQLTSTIAEVFNHKGIAITNAAANGKESLLARPVLPADLTTLQTHLSPPLDSINYWFLKKSINLYGEDLVKTLGYEKKQCGCTDSGLAVIKSFWKNNGITTSSINMIDGSGLSPQNRITAEALVKVLQFARTRNWFKTFYSDLPIINGITMKSGSIGGARSFTGYVNGYTFAIIANNYNGSSAEIVRKLYKVLDVLK